MAHGSALADEVCGDDRLTVAGAERVGGAPEEREGECQQDAGRAQVSRDERLESRAVLLCHGRRELRRRALPIARIDLGPRLRDRERAREPVRGIGAQLSRRAYRRGTRRRDARAAERRDDDFLPADAAGVRLVSQGERCRLLEPRPCEHQLVTRRRQPSRARWKLESLALRLQLNSAAVHEQFDVGNDLAAQRGRIDASSLASLERRDLRHVEDVVHVHAVSRHDDRARVVDREVAERMGRRNRR